MFFQVILPFGGRSETCTKVSNLQGSCQGPTGTAAWAQNCPQWQFKVETVHDALFIGIYLPGVKFFMAYLHMMINQKQVHGAKNTTI